MGIPQIESPKFLLPIFDNPWIVYTVTRYYYRQFQYQLEYKNVLRYTFLLTKHTPMYRYA